MNLDYLKSLEKRYHHKRYILTDPIKYCYYFNEPQNIELVGLMIALFAYGNIKAMFRFMDNLIKILQPYPYEKILNFRENSNIDLYYRFQNKNDIKNIIITLKKFFINNNIKNYLLNKKVNNIYEIIDPFIREIQDYIPKKFLSDGLKHYFCLGNQNSVLKRYCLFFRWMIRKDFPDLGIYDFFEPKILVYPIDTHILNFAYKNQIIKSKISSRKNALIITNYFCQFAPNDPVKYDFYITRELMLKNSFRYENIL